MSQPCKGNQAAEPKSLHWSKPLLAGEIPVWSRLLMRNADGDLRSKSETKVKAYHVEIRGCLYSLWGLLHPDDNIFNSLTRGRQHLACCVMACCAGLMYPLCNWNEALMNSIVYYADQYHFESCANLRDFVHPFELEHYNKLCDFTTARLSLDFEHFFTGEINTHLPTSSLPEGKLCDILVDFFAIHNLGIICFGQRSLAIGYSEPDGYFMYDSNASGFPLLATNTSATYVLRTLQLLALIICINKIIPVNITSSIIQFHVFAVKIEVLKLEIPLQEDTSSCTC